MQAINISERIGNGYGFDISDAGDTTLLRPDRKEMENGSRG